MLKETNLLVRKGVDVETRNFTYEMFIVNPFRYELVKKQKHNEDIDKEIKANLMDNWNHLIYSEIRDKLTALRSRVMRETDDDRSIGAELADIINLCQIQPNDR